jgi:hypothetical protein
VKHLKTFESLNTLKLYKSKTEYDFSNDEVTLKFQMTDIHKEIIKKLGKRENLFSKMTFSNIFKKDTWNELKLLPYIEDLKSLSLVIDLKRGMNNLRLTDQGLEYYSFLKSEK